LLYSRGAAVKVLGSCHGSLHQIFQLEVHRFPSSLPLFFSLFRPFSPHSPSRLPRPFFDCPDLPGVSGLWLERGNCRNAEALLSSPFAMRIKPFFLLPPSPSLSLVIMSSRGPPFFGFPIPPIMESGSAAHDNLERKSGVLPSLPPSGSSCSFNLSPLSFPPFLPFSLNPLPSLSSLPRLKTTIYNPGHGFFC